jgi:hypothetical protein
MRQIPACRAAISEWLIRTSVDRVSACEDQRVCYCVCSLSTDMPLCVCHHWSASSIPRHDRFHQTRCVPRRGVYSVPISSGRSSANESVVNTQKFNIMIHRESVLSSPALVGYPISTLSIHTFIDGNPASGRSSNVMAFMLATARSNPV